MKKALTLIVTVFLFSTCFAQNDVLHVDLVNAVYGRLNAGIEHALTDRLSARLSFLTGTFVHSEFVNVETYILTGDAWTPELLYYPLSEESAPFGFFVGVGYRYLRFEHEYDGYGFVSRAIKGSLHSWGISLGYKYHYKRFSAELLAGYSIGKVKHDNEREANYVVPSKHLTYIKDKEKSARLELSIGYALSGSNPKPAGERARELPPSFSFGLKGGWNMNNTVVNYELKFENGDSKRRGGVHFGLFARVKLNPRLYFVPEVQFVEKGYRYVSSQNDAPEMALNYVEFPIVLSYLLKDFIAAEIGPVAGFLVHAESSALINDHRHDSYKKSFEFGVTGGLRFDLSQKVGVGARYFQGVSNISDVYTDEQGKEHNYNVQLSMYLRLIKSKE